jgi:F-box/leucine-rich repeat protein 10/11
METPRNGESTHLSEETLEADQSSEGVGILKNASVGAHGTGGSDVSPPQVRSGPKAAASDGLAPTGDFPSSTSLVSPPTSLSDDMENVTMLEGHTSTMWSASNPAPFAGETHDLDGQAGRSNQLVPKTTPERVPSYSMGQGSSWETVVREEGHITPSEEKRSVDGRRQDHSQGPISPSRQLKAGGKRDRSSLMDVDADPESLRLIRELQEQDFGLRKRRSKS